MQQINQEEGTTIILTTHYLEEAEQLCKNIAILDHGEVRINTDMKSLLASLDVETFVLDLIAPLQRPVRMNDVVKISQPDALSLEITVSKGASLNHVFAQLSEQQIKVASMRNKNNRLEELFMNLVDKNLSEPLSDTPATTSTTSV